MNKKMGKVLTLGIIIAILVSVLGVFAIPRTNDIHYQNQGTDATPPRNLYAKGYEGYVNLRWDEPANGADQITGYNIYRSLNQDIKVYLTSVSVSEQNYRDEEVDNGRVYYYWVTAEYGNNQETDFSNRDDAQPFGTSPPTQPKDLEAFPGDEKVELTWESPDDDGGDDIDNYEIYRGTESGEESHIDTVAPSESYVDNNVSNGITYYYQVRAINGAGESPISNEVSVTPIEDLSTPESPSNLQAFIGSDHVELHWDAPLDDGGSSIMSYKIYRENTATSQKRKFSADKNKTFYVDEDIDPGYDYKYKVSAVNVAGEGLTSNEVKAETVTTGFPPAPRNLDAESRDEKVKLSWGEPSYDSGTVLSYHIYRGSTPTGLQYHTTVSGETEFTDKKVDNDNTYYYKVKAVSSDKLIGLDSNVDSATPLEAEDQDSGGGMWIPLLIIVIVLLGGIIFYMWWMNQEEAKGPQQPDQHEWQRSPQEEQTPPPPPESEQGGEGYQQQPPPPGQQQGEIDNPPQNEPEDDWSL